MNEELYGERRSANVHWVVAGGTGSIPVSFTKGRKFY